MQNSQRSHRKFVQSYSAVCHIETNQGIEVLGKRSSMMVLTSSLVSGHAARARPKPPQVACQNSMSSSPLRPFFDPFIPSGAVSFKQVSVRRQSIWHQLSYFLRDTFLPVFSLV